MRHFNTFLVVTITGALIWGCSGEAEQEKGNPLVPRIAGLSKTELTVGETVYVVGDNFLPLEEGRTELVFDGTFQRDSDGAFEKAHFVVTPLFDGELVNDTEINGIDVDAESKVLRLSRFGPFEVPFTANGDETGTFSGTLTARNVLTDGQSFEQASPVDVTIKVRPSIIIRKFEPFVGFEADGKTPLYAGCGTPAIRALHNLPYVLEVEAVGFEPAFFIYDFTAINGMPDQVTFSHPAKPTCDGSGNNCVWKDSIGDPESKQMIVFNQVAELDTFYWAVVRITATSTDGQSEFVETALPISVHRPLEFRLDSGGPQPAETFEPVPVTGCMCASAPGVTANYSETHTESRQNAVSVSVSKTWSQAQGVTNASDWSEGISESTALSNSSSENWSHSESETMGETYGITMNHSDSQSANFSSTEGDGWAYSYNEGTTNQQMETQMGELFGQARSSVNVEVGAEGSVPGFAKVSGKVGTTVGATVGAKTGNTVGETNGSSADYGYQTSGQNSTTEGFGSVTTDSSGETLQNSYALSAQDQVGGTTTQGEVQTSSKVYNFGGSSSQSDVVTVGDSETWAETWTTTSADTVSVATGAKIPVDSCAMFYRQTTRWVRKGYLYSHNLCGVRELMGDSTFNEWTWAAELAIQGSPCDGGNFPQPKGISECLVGPCY